MSVPNQYKGFSRLPEHVQRRMDPQLAQKYQMGGAVMQRPLFRQAGGPAQPMPQDMPPAGPDANMGQDMNNIEQAVSGQMEQVGQEYAMRMMQGLDAAEDYKGVIDSLRGNDRPIEARYQELAGLVGAEDAQATPESVLTLVQPTIMMTEQGAMDSGIGELMQAVAGQVDMQTADGAPTEMAGGVGSLMAAGAGNTPPANFSQGGPVRLQAGGNPQLEKYYQDMLPLYESILGPSEEQKNMTQAQALFAIADAAGRFASGQGAGGQDLRGLSPAAQLGGAITGLGGQLGALGAQGAEQERALKLAALQAAQGEYSADRAAARAAAARGPQFSLTTLYDANGKAVSVNTATPEGVAEAQKLLQQGYSADKGVTKSKFTEFDGNLYDVSGSTPKLVLKGSKDRTIEQVGDTLLDITDPNNIITLYKDPTTDQKVTTIDNNLIDYTDPNNVKILYKGAQDAKTVTVGNVVLDITDPNKIKEIYKGPVPRKTATVGGQLIDYTDPNNVQVLYGDKTRQYRVVDGTLLDITDPQNTVTVFKAEKKPDIRIFDNQAVDFTDVNNPKTIFTAPKDAKTATVGGVLLDVTDTNNIKTLYKSAPDQKTATVQGQLIDYTDPNNVKVLFGDKTRQYRVVDNTLLDITDPQNPVTVFEGKTKPDIRIINGAALDFTDPKNPQTLYQAPKDAKTTTVDGVLLDITDTNNIKTLYQAEPDRKTATVQGQLIDYTDPNNVKVLFGDKKRDYRTVQGNIIDVTDPKNPVTVFTAPVDDTPKTQLERDRLILTDSEKIKQFGQGALPQADTDLLVQVLNDYIVPVAGPQGTKSKPIPPQIQRALKQRQQLGLDTFGIDPALFGQAISANDFEQLTQNIIDPNVDLEKGAGFLSGLASALNYLGEQTIGELGVGSGTAFKGTKEAKQAFEALASSTRKFVLEGKQLATELNLTLTELPDGAFTKTDAGTLSNIKTQQQQLDMFIQRVSEALKTPQSFTAKDLSDARLQLNFAVQLKKAYDAAYNNLAPGAGGKTTGDKPKASDFRR